MNNRPKVKLLQHHTQVCRRLYYDITLDYNISLYAAFPSVLTHEIDIDANPGHPVNLPCDNQGYPRPTVTWRRNGTALVNGTEEWINVVNLRNSLRTTIHRVSYLLDYGSWHIPYAIANDSGVYTCSARNNLGVATGTVRLNIGSGNQNIY